MADLVPDGFSIKKRDREGQRGGGIALIYKNNLIITTDMEQSDSPTFEAITVTLESSDTSRTKIILCYRPPGHNPNFNEDFSQWVSMCCISSQSTLLAGDFNLWLEQKEDLQADTFKENTQDLGFIHINSEPTHIKGHTLDGILTRNIAITVTSHTPLAWTDHFLISFNWTPPIPIKRDRPPPNLALKRTCRSLPTGSEEHIKTILREDWEGTHSCARLLETFNTTIHPLLEAHCPKKLGRIQSHSSPWYTLSLKTMKRENRRLEAKWQKHQYDEDRIKYLRANSLYKTEIKKAKEAFWGKHIEEGKNQAKTLFATISKIINPPQATCLPRPSLALCTDLSTFFEEKIEKIRNNIMTQKHPTITESVNTPDNPPQEMVNIPQFSFSPVSQAQVQQALQTLKPTDAAIDTIPAWFLKEYATDICPFITDIINASFRDGDVPETLKKGFISPRLKKPNTDPKIMGHYRPITELTVISKILEKAGGKQLQSFCDSQGILHPLQSGFRPGYGTETAMVALWDSILEISDLGEVSMLILLDLSAAFDTIEHNTLITRCAEEAHFSATALKWMKSFLTDRFSAVKMGIFQAPDRRVTCGVPQGSPLSPLAFNIYVIPLIRLIESFKIGCHTYADDTQLFFRINGDKQQYDTLIACAAAIKEWMIDNFLQLNAAKTEVILFCPKQCQNRTKLAFPLPRLFENPVTLSEQVKSLGFVLDAEMTLKKQVSKVVSACFFRLKQLRPTLKFIPTTHHAIIVGAAINSRLDYCNGLYGGLTKTLVHRLQLTQNAAGRMVLGLKKRDHISQGLRDLHWLPVSKRINFKILCLTRKCIYGDAPTYLARKINRYDPDRNLRSRNKDLLIIPRVQTKSRGERRFSFQAPTLWNKLPDQIKNKPTMTSFRKALKTHLFSI